MRAPFYVFICKWFDREVKYACAVLTFFRSKKKIDFNYDSEKYKIYNLSHCLAYALCIDEFER